MKKIVITLIILIISLGLIACESEVFERIEYSNGDRVIRNGIIFEYFDLNVVIRDQEFNNRVFSFDSNDNYPIHSHYYFDMTSRNQEPIKPFDFSLRGSDEFMRIAYAIGSANNARTLGGWYFSLGFLTGLLNTSDLTWFDGTTTRCMSGFIVVGRSDERIRNIVIPGVVDGNFVFGIGFGAFQNTNITSFRWENRPGGWFSGSPVTIILPYAFDNTKYLESITLPTGTGRNIIFSKGVSNSSVREITNVHALMDASFYNLEELETVILGIGFGTSNRSGTFTYNEEVLLLELNLFAGFRRSAFYKTPNLTNIISNTIFYQNGVFYWIAGTDFENQTVIEPIFFLDGFRLNVDIIRGGATIRLNQDGTYTMAGFNLGREVSGELYSERSEDALAEEGYIHLQWGSIRNNLSNTRN